jgi:hypothetical protein
VNKPVLRSWSQFLGLLADKDRVKKSTRDIKVWSSNGKRNLFSIMTSAIHPQIEEIRQSTA